MSVFLHFLVGGVAGGAVSFLAFRYDLAGWLCHIYARALGASWFTPRYACPSCNRRVHLVRSRPDRAGIFGPADGGGRCLSCSSTTPRNAPGRTESAGQVLPGISGWPQARSDAQGQAQERTDERNDHA